MPRFDKFQIKELKDYLYKSNIHDGRFKYSHYDREKKMLSIDVINPIYNVEINFVFYGVKIIIPIIGNEQGSRETILSLTVEEDDYPHIDNCTEKCEGSIDNSLYLLFQMFSGDELHVISKGVFINISHEQNLESGKCPDHYEGV